MRTFIYKLINLPRRITAVLLAGAIALSGSGMLISTIKETNAEPILDPAKFAPSYGQVSAVYFKDAGINQLGGIALDGFGKVWAWGWNQHGQLGINKGYGINSSAANLQGYAGGMVRIPYFVDNDITVIDVSAGYHFNLALDDEGNVYSWGHNNNQQTGFTVNTTFPSGTGRIEPAKVEGLPKIIKIAANNGYLDENISMALDENNSLWIWGSNTSGEHGQGNITITPSYRATPHKVVFPEEITITEFCAGGWTTGASVNVLDSGGNRWTWGQNISHMLGLGVTTANFTTPQKAVPVSGMGKLVDISSSYQATLALDDNGNLWQWGVIYGTGDTPFSSTVYPVPVQVQTDPAEITRLGYTPVPQSVSAGESTYYFIDQYGRPWTWGSGRYFGFGREGGYENSNKQVTAVAQQYPRVMGDGDTQVFDTDKKTPGDGRIPSFMGNYGFNDMHPTVYDVKYQGKPPEDIWKNFAFQPIPKLNRIFASRSSYMLLDEDGNIYRWGNDGSGSIAWGWDYEPAYDNTGNIYDGLYDKYLYEVILMRGMPYLEPVTFTLGSKANTKIYKGVSPVQTDTVTVDVFLPANFHSPQMNIYFSSTIREIKYVIISADPLNPDFNISDPTREQFDAAYLNALYPGGDLLTEGHIVSQDDAIIINKEFKVSDNCKVWVLVNDIAYTKETNTIHSYSADNFYTPLDLFQKGVKKSDPAEVLFDLEQDQVIKVYPTIHDLTHFGLDESKYSDQEENVYGIPLYADGTVIPNPGFGHDQVKITALDAEDHSLALTIAPEPSPQPNPVIYTLDMDYALARPHYNDRNPDGSFTSQAKIENTHTFQYIISLPNKSAYINGSVKPGNGIQNEPVMVKAEDEIEYRITAENKREDPDEPGNITVIDKIPPGLTVIPSSISHNGVYDAHEHTITWVLNEETEEVTVCFFVTVTDTGIFENTAEVTYYDGSNESTNTTYHMQIPPHPVTEEFYVFDPAAPYKGIQLQEDREVLVNHGADYYRGLNPHATIDKDGVSYTYYGVSVNEALPDTRPLSGEDALPARLIESVEDDGNVVTYLYERTKWIVVERFHEFGVAGTNILQNNNEVTVGDNLPYNPEIGTPANNINKDGKKYEYYGYQVNGVFYESLPSVNPIDRVKSNQEITFLYRTSYEIIEHFYGMDDPPSLLRNEKINGVTMPGMVPAIYSGDSFEAIPPMQLIYNGYYWNYAGCTLDGGALTTAVLQPFVGISKDHIIMYFYDKGEPVIHTLNLRQIVLDYTGETRLPYIGYFHLKNDGKKYNITTDSNKDGTEVGFRSIKTSLSGIDKIYTIDAVLPQYYKYAGFISTTSYSIGSHNPALKQSSAAEADFTSSNEIWVTVFIIPKDDPGKHDWDFKTNDFGVIKQ